MGLAQALLPISFCGGDIYTLSSRSLLRLLRPADIALGSLQFAACLIPLRRRPSYAASVIVVSEPYDISRQVLTPRAFLTTGAGVDRSGYEAHGDAFMFSPGLKFEPTFF